MNPQPKKACLDAGICSSPTFRKTSGEKRTSSITIDLVQWTVYVLFAVVLITTCSLFLYVWSVQKELIRLREDVVNIENCLRRNMKAKNDIKRNDDHSSDAYEGRLAFSSSHLVPVLSKGDTERNRVPIQMVDVSEERFRSKQNRRIRRSPTANPELSERKPRAERKAKQKSTKAVGIDGRRLQKSGSTISAVHFHAKNTSSRTITTTRNSPVLNFWHPAKWSNLTSNSFYHIRDGTVTILEDGLYFIYAQLVFHDLSGRWSFSININDRQELKCINSEHISAAASFHPTNHGVYQHCFSSSLFHVRRLEQVTVRSLYEQRSILLSPEFTFWGIIKMS